MSTRLLTCVALTLIVCAGSARAQPVQISIDKIVQDASISGHVAGLAQTTAPQYRVVVYVHTDMWYIHPYAGQGVGKSWAAIQPNGDWSIETIKREFVADRVAALVVLYGVAVPARTADIAGIPHTAITVRDLANTPDFGKL